MRARSQKCSGLQSKRGSASAVVVMVTVLLAVFGVLALVSSYSGLKLAQRHATWSSDYYKVDAEAEAMLASIEGDLAAAAAKAGSTSASGTFPDLAAEALSLRVPSEQGSFTGDASGLTVRIRVGSIDGQNIRMELRIDFSDAGIPARFCRIVSWRQWQKPFQYDENPGDVWEGNG
jgi:hypothetical protein